VRRGATLKDGDQIVGNRTKIKVVKNKVAAPFKEAEVDLIHGFGFSREADVLDLGVAQSVVEKSGSWFSFSGERVGQGRDNARQFLRDNPETMARVEAAVRARLGIGVEAAATAAVSAVKHSSDPLFFSQTAVSRALRTHANEKCPENRHFLHFSLYFALPAAVS
jgi:recombination protein RecA